MKRTMICLVLLLMSGCYPGSTSSAPHTSSTLPPALSPSRTHDRSTSTNAEIPAHNSSPSCDGEVVFDFPPVDLDAVEYLVPFGLMVDSHVTPVDHHYFQNFAEPDRDIAVYAPGPGRVVSIQHFGTPVAENPQGIVDDYRLVIEHTCTVSSIFIHIDQLTPRLAAQDPGVGSYASIDVAVDAGELIGTFTENVDFNLVDLDYTVAGLIEPTSYRQEPWKIHVPDTLDYFATEIREQLENLSLRTAEPRSGRFAYDVDGRLVGNWFQADTNGYAGADARRYWAGHLSFAYDHLDPTMIVVSIGTFDDQSGQFAILGNAPDPAEISVDTGPVVYDLVDWDYTVDGEHWDRRTFATNIEATPGRFVKGAIAVQLIDQQELLVEILPGATAGDFAGFSANATAYSR